MQDEQTGMMLSKVQGLVTAFNAVSAVTSVVVKWRSVQGSNTGKSILLTVIYVSLSPMRDEPPERRNHVFLTFVASIVSDIEHLFDQQIFIKCLYVL